MVNQGKSNEPTWVRFLTGGTASSIAEVATLPVDMAKVRLQVQGSGAKVYSNLFDCIYKVAKTEGVGALYKGLAPGLLRQMSYSSIRMGIYEPIRDLIAWGTPTDEISFFKRILAGGTAGAIGIAIANPTELLKVRMQADKTGTRYPNGVMDAFVKTYKAEGLRGMWQGVIPNMQRAYIVNAAELAAYDQAKIMLIKLLGADPDKVTTHLGAAMTSGIFAAICCQPVDLVKNRLMNQPAGPGITPMYTGMIDCMVKMAKSEGVMSLYKGVGANMARLGAWCVVMFTSYEQLRILLRKTY